MVTNESVVIRHVEDVAFLWRQRRAALRTNQTTDAQRRRLDMRLQANLEGAWLGGEVARAAAAEQLEWRPEAGAAFAAATLTLLSAGGGRALLARVLAGAERDESVNAAVVSAMGWHAFVDIEALLVRWSASSEPTLAQLAVAGFASHRRSPGRALARGLRRQHPGVRAAAAKAVGDLGEQRHGRALRMLLVDRSSLVRFQAARALARFGVDCADVSHALLVTSEAGSSHSADAAAALVRLAPTDGLSLFRRWARVKSLRRMASVVAASLGSRDLVESILPWMNDDETARDAGEAFRTITGADLLVCDLARARPAYAPGDPTDDPDDAHVELPADYSLPFPSPVRVGAWWKRKGARFASGVRYLDGLPVGAAECPLDREHLDNLRMLVRSGRPHHQTMAARALAQARPALAVIETHAFATGVHVLPGWEAFVGERPAVEGGARARA